MTSLARSKQIIGAHF